MIVAHMSEKAWSQMQFSYLSYIPFSRRVDLFLMAHTRQYRSIFCNWSYVFNDHTKSKHANLNCSICLFIKICDVTWSIKMNAQFTIRLLSRDDFIKIYTPKKEYGCLYVWVIENGPTRNLSIWMTEWHSNYKEASRVYT